MSWILIILHIYEKIIKEHNHWDTVVKKITCQLENLCTVRNSSQQSRQRSDKGHRTGDGKVGDQVTAARNLNGWTKDTLSCKCTVCPEVNKPFLIILFTSEHIYIRTIWVRFVCWLVKRLKFRRKRDSTRQYKADLACTTQAKRYRACKAVAKEQAEERIRDLFGKFYSAGEGNI